MSWTIKSKIESFDVQPNGNVKISSLLKLFQKAAGDAEGILAFKGGHEAHHILPFAVVEAGGGALFPGAGKDGGKGLFAEGVALCRAGEDDLLHAPAGQSGKMGTRHRSASFPVRL